MDLGNSNVLCRLREVVNVVPVWQRFCFHLQQSDFLFGEVAKDSGSDDAKGFATSGPGDRSDCT